MNARRRSSAITAESDNLSFSSTLTSRPVVATSASGIGITPSGSVEESSLDFREEMSRPITTSTMLMESYRKFLPLYSLVIDGELARLEGSCRGNYTQIVNKIFSDTPEKIGAIPKLALLREGLLREKSYYKPHDDTKNVFSAIFDQQQFEATAGSNANFMSNTKTSIEICIDVNISIFVTPLSVEISEELMKKANFAGSRPHPSRLVHDLLASCSLRQHEQA
uniref:Uncharacterized protein n=1 Tax=Romanomermis culicivorax TaxID=13658 RepID=A0A915K7L2_ROMCU